MSTNETALAVPEPQSIEGLIALAVQHGSAIEPLERLMSMRRELKAEAAREAFFEALSAFQADCPVIPKTRTARVDSQSGAGYTYHYAPLEVIVAAVSSILRRYGLSYRFDTAFEADPPAQVVTCIVHHRDGHSESSGFRTPVDARARMNDMQKSASAQTYAKRYAFCNAFGILTGDEDNDGRGGGAPPAPNVVRTSPNPAVQDGQVVPSGVRPVGKNLVRIKPVATKLEQVIEDAKDVPALRSEVVQMAMAIEVMEREGRGQTPPPNEVIEPMAHDRCQEWLSRTYGEAVETATGSQLEALRRVLGRRISQQEQKAG